jgi:hypothetical protein
MRRAPCRTCKNSLPIAKMYVIDGVMVCEPCGTRRVTEGKLGGRALVVERALDPTLCAQCGADKGDTEWLKVAGSPLCFQCRQRFYEVPYPAWMRVALIALTLAAAYAVWHGEQYVEAGVARARGERLLAEQQYARAAVELRQVLAAGSESEDVLLMAVKAYLLAGDYEHARLLMNGHPRFATGPLYYEVLKLWERAVKANDLAAEARRLTAQQDYAAAAAKAREAALLYPEMAALGATAQALEAQANAPAPAAGKAAR